MTRLGSTQRLVLTALNGDIWDTGYTATEIAAWTRRNSRNHWDRLTADSVYGALKRLHAHGHVAVTGRQDKPAGREGPAARIWQITDAGRKALKHGTEATT